MGTGTGSECGWEEKDLGENKNYQPRETITMWKKI